MFEHWEPAEGAVIDRRQKGNSQDNMSANLHFVVEVRPTDGQPFRVELGMPGLFGDFIPPSPGQVVRMEVDVAKQKARFDTSDPDVSAKARRKAGKDRFAEELETPPGAD